jgi:hypothetical protein
MSHRIQTGLHPEGGKALLYSLSIRQLAIQFCAKMREKHFTTKTRNIETTKFMVKPFRVFVLSCFRDYFLLPVYPGWVLGIDRLPAFSHMTMRSII